MKGNRLALRNALATSLYMASIKVSSSSASSPLASIVRPLSRRVCSMVAMMQGQIVFIGRNLLSTIAWASADCQVLSLDAPVATGRRPSMTNLQDTWGNPARSVWAASEALRRHNRFHAPPIPDCLVGEAASLQTD